MPDVISLKTAAHAMFVRINSLYFHWFHKFHMGMDAHTMFIQTWKIYIPLRYFYTHQLFCHTNWFVRPLVRIQCTYKLILRHTNWLDGHWWPYKAKPVPTWKAYGPSALQFPYKLIFLPNTNFLVCEAMHAHTMPITWKLFGLTRLYEHQCRWACNAHTLQFWTFTILNHAIPIQWQVWYTNSNTCLGVAIEYDTAGHVHVHVGCSFRGSWAPL